MKKIGKCLLFRIDINEKVYAKILGEAKYLSYIYRVNMRNIFAM